MLAYCFIFTLAMSIDRDKVYMIVLLCMIIVQDCNNSGLKKLSPCNMGFSPPENSSPCHIINVRTVSPKDTETDTSQP